MSAILKNLFVIAILIGTIALGYFLYKQNATANFGAKAELTQRLEIESAQILRRLNELSSVELGGEIFYDPRFSSLFSVAAPVSAEPVGNSNPFEIN